MTSPEQFQIPPLGMLDLVNAYTKDEHTDVEIEIVLDSIPVMLTLRPDLSYYDAMWSNQKFALDCLPNVFPSKTLAASQSLNKLSEMSFSTVNRDEIELLIRSAFGTHVKESANQYAHIRKVLERYAKNAAVRKYLVEVSKQSIKNQ